MFGGLKGALLLKYSPLMNVNGALMMSGGVGLWGLILDGMALIFLLTIVNGFVGYWRLFGREDSGVGWCLEWLEGAEWVCFCLVWGAKWEPVLGVKVGRKQGEISYINRISTVYLPCLVRRVPQAVSRHVRDMIVGVTRNIRDKIGESGVLLRSGKEIYSFNI